MIKSPKEKYDCIITVNLEDLKEFPYTMIFYEAPHRIDSTIKNLFEVFGNRNATIARELTKINEEYIRGTLEELVLF